MGLKPKLLVLQGRKHFDVPTFADSPAVRAVFDVTRSKIYIGKPDVVFCQSYLQCSSELYKSKVPSVIVVGTDPWHEFKLAGLSGRLKSMGKLFSRVDSVMCASEFVRKAVAPKLKTDNVHCLPAGLWGIDHVKNGVQPARFTPRTHWKIHERPVALTSIIMNDTKMKKSKWAGVPMFLKAADAVAKKHKVRYLNSGRGTSEFSKLKPWKEKYGFEWVQHHHLDEDVDHWPGILNGADVFFYPSTYDGWGRVVADAMCSAVPSLIFNRTAPPEIGKSLLLCDPNDPEGIADKFNHLLVDEDFRKSTAKRQYAEAMELTEKHRGDIAHALLLTMNKDKKGLRRWASRDC